MSQTVLIFGLAGDILGGHERRKTDTLAVCALRVTRSLIGGAVTLFSGNRPEPNSIVRPNRLNQTTHTSSSLVSSHGNVSRRSEKLPT
ncbi:unnamed protein product [Caenorhabditis auriculariae]|uniref:Uncharacterized protein n=1 Tax=Caenorhabditis auriculariae TaxID=2777116 RepID=A0A8S1HNG7_9PELO|nr:unnamed protein product [Caenorhabditis auriculariae]